MPTYDYECEKCHAVFELFQSMKDAPIEVCPEGKCAMKDWGHGKVKRLLGTGAGLIFKGSGFYITDYRSENYKKAAKSDTGGGGAKSDTGGGGAKSDKPASGGGSSTGSGSTSSGGGSSSAGKE